MRVTGHAPWPAPLGSLPRTALIERLSDGSASGITLLRAPTGYGKTGTAADWFDARPDEHPRVHWHRCTPGEDLFTSLATGLDGADDSAGDGERTPASGIAALSAAIERERHPLTLVIDDYHHASSAENDLALAELCAATPDLSLVVIARRVRVLDGPLVTARTRVRVIGHHDLRFTEEETRLIAADSRFADHPHLPEALERAEGWPLAVRAALDRLPGEPATGADSPDALHDPLQNLTRFALQHLEILDNHARRILLSAAQLDAIDFAQAAEVAECSAAAARDAIHELSELGVLEPVPAPDRTDFRCHAAVQTALAARSERSFSAARRTALLRGRAERVEATAPFTAFALLSSAGEYAGAELLLARYFTVITDEGEACSRVLLALPESALLAHPTFAAARIMTELPDPAVSPTILSSLLEVWGRGLEAQRSAELDEDAAGQDPLILPMLTQSMALARLSGQIELAAGLAEQIEVQLGSVAPGSPADVYRGSLPMYFREIAATALAAGDYDRTRRNLEALRAHSQAKIDAPWSGFPPGCTRKVSDPESGRRWLLASLNELAFTELVTGDVTRAAELLADAEAITAATGSRAPGLSWVGGEVVRAHLAYETRDPGLIERALERLLPIAPRIEQRPNLIIAETLDTRYRRGAERALVELQAQIQTLDPAQINCICTVEATLHIALGDFDSARSVLAPMPETHAFAQLERARLALFLGNDVEALLLAQSVSNPDATKRQRLDRSLITAAAAWNCGGTNEATTALRDAAELLEACGLPSTLWNVPHNLLREVAVAARETGVCDIVALIDDVPEPARCHRYERLTEMELRTLTTIAEHQTAGQAAAVLFITPATVKKHLTAVYRKLQVGSRDEAILRAARMGLLPSVKARREAG